MGSLRNNLQEQKEWISQSNENSNKYNGFSFAKSYQSNPLSKLEFYGPLDPVYKKNNLAHCGVKVCLLILVIISINKNEGSSTS